jgi:hypothetical protein
MADIPANALPVRDPGNTRIGWCWHAEDGYHVIDDRWRIESVHERQIVAERHCYLRTQCKHRAAAEVIGEALDLLVEQGLLEVAVERMGCTPIGLAEKDRLVRMIERSREIRRRSDELAVVLEGARA